MNGIYILRQFLDAVIPLVVGGGNRFISEKYKTVQTFKLHFLQNRHPVQLYTYASDCKIETFL
jgi:hypothetical protein